MADHHCHAVGCGVPVPPKMHMCLAHWRMVPKVVQDLIWKHYRPGQEIDKRLNMDYIATAFVSISSVALKEGKPLPSLCGRRTELADSTDQTPLLTGHADTSTATATSTPPEGK